MLSRVTGSRGASYVAVALAGALIGAGGLALGASGGGVIRACVSKRTGALRLATRCKKHERPVFWNVQGQHGVRGPQGSRGATGTRGATGAPGPRGSQGIRGQKGATGTTGPPGPTAGVTSAPGATPSAAPNSAFSGAATITTTTSSKLLISGVANNVLVVCGAVACTQTWGLYLNGQPLPGSSESISQGPNSSSGIRSIVTTAATGLLPAGTYTVTMKDNEINAINQGANTPRVTITALGG